MKIRDGFIGTVGNTPLIKLRRASEETGCTILGKAEFLNPGGSVKDRAALFIIKDAEERVSGDILFGLHIRERAIDELEDQVTLVGLGVQRLRGEFDAWRAAQLGLGG